MIPGVIDARGSPSSFAILVAPLDVSIDRLAVPHGADSHDMTVIAVCVGIRVIVVVVSTKTKTPATARNGDRRRSRDRLRQSVRHRRRSHRRRSAHHHHHPCARRRHHPWPPPPPPPPPWPPPPPPPRAAAGDTATSATAAAATHPKITLRILELLFSVSFGLTTRHPQDAGLADTENCSSPSSAACRELPYLRHSCRFAPAS